MSIDDAEDGSGFPAPGFEVARRPFWTAVGDACERERVPRAFADEAIVSPESDHATLARVLRAEFSDLVAAVRDCDRVLEQPVGGRWAPVPLAAGAVSRAVADVATNRILASIGGAEPRRSAGSRRPLAPGWSWIRCRQAASVPMRFSLASRRATSSGATGTTPRPSMW